MAFLTRLLLISVLFCSIPSLSPAMVKEFRGVWFRPQGNKAEIIKDLDNIKKAGFNAVFVETFYQGHTIYPSRIFPQRLELVGEDRLALIIAESHKRNLEVHCWLHTLFWRLDPKNQMPEPKILKEHQDWLDHSRDGKLTRDYEINNDFVNPAIPEVRKVLKQLVTEILTKYRPEGIHFDYIRYAANGDNYGFGYNPIAMKLFKTRYKFNPMILDPDKTPDAWELWCKFREDQVTELLADLSKAVRTISPRVKVSAAVFPDYYEDRYKNSKMQNYEEWCKKKYIDFLTPMCYDYATSGIIREIRAARDHTGGIPIYPGLAARKGSPHPDFPTQISIVRRENPAGHSLFAYNWLVTYPGIFDILAKDIYKEPAEVW